MKKNAQKLLALGLGTAMLPAALLGLTGCQQKEKSLLDPQNPVTVTVWNYYNGDQLSAFDKLVEDFNAGPGAEKGIVVVSVSQGDISTLANALLDSVAGKAGADNPPDLAAIYAETAYILDEQDALAPMDSYFTADELAAYVPGFIEEGRFNADNELLLFPICKSTELFAANVTDWASFADATGVTLDSIKTKEDLTAAAKTYYEWTDSLTPATPEDGKALYGRDSIANYIYLGSYQLGHEMFPVANGKMTIDMDRDTFKTLWDNYYIPYINGYFGSYGNFRSEDAKTGRILSMTSSSSGMSFMPSQVTDENDNSHAIEMVTRSALPFADATVDSTVQQGASFCLLKSTDAAQAGAVEFLKWFSAPEQNVDFALASGYSPVTVAANTADTITSSYTGDTSTAKGKLALETLLVSADAFATKISYAAKPFNGSKDVRSLMESSLSDICAADRAAVESALASGASHEDAVAPYCTDAYFDAWFTALSDEVAALTAE